MSNKGWLSNSPLRACQINKAELASSHILGLQIGGLNDDTHDEMTPGRLLVHLRR